MILILPDRFEQPGQQRRPHDLILCGFGVRELHRRGAIIAPVQEAEILVVGAEDQGHDLGPAGHGGLEADDVGELVDGEGLGDGGGDGGEGARQLVEAVGDADVFHDVGLVEDVGSGGRDEDVEGVRVGGGGGGGRVGHAEQQGAGFLGGEVEAAAGVDVGEGGGGGARGEVGDEAGFVVVGGGDADLFDGEGGGGVLGKHADEDVIHDFEFGAVGCGEVDEDVAGLEGDFAVIGVDDGGHRADCPIGVEDDRVDR